MKLLSRNINSLPKKNLLITSSFILFILCVFLFVTYPFFHDGFFSTFDDIQVVRIDVMSQELKSGQFPVRFVNELGNGGGYFLYNFYSPLVYYIGSFFHLLGFSLVKATKLTFLLGYVLGLLGTFVLLKKYVSYSFSILGAGIFITSIYLAYDSYTRGALGEFFAFSLLPWVFWSFLKLKDRGSYLNMCVAGLSYAVLILTHNITSYCVFPFLALIFFIGKFEKKSLLHFIGAVSLGLMISATYTIPLFFDYKFVNLSSNPSITGQYLTNFLNPLELSGLSKTNFPFRPPLMGFTIFIPTLAIILFKLLKKKKNPIIIYASIGFLISVFIVSDLSQFIWEGLPYLKFVQFPWRFLSVATILSTIILVIFFSKKKYIGKIAIILITLSSIFVYSSYFRPTDGYNYISKYRAEDPCQTTTWANEYLPTWIKECLVANNKTPLVSGKAQVSNLNQESNGRVIKFNSVSDGGKLLIRRYFFPGWTVFVDENKVEAYSDGPNGLLAFNVPSGNHEIKVMLVETQINTLSNLMSFSALLVTLLYMLFSIKIKK